MKCGLSFSEKNITECSGKCLEQRKVEQVSTLGYDTRNFVTYTSHLVMGETRNMYRILVGKSLGTRLLGKSTNLRAT